MTPCFFYMFSRQKQRGGSAVNNGLPKVTFLAVAEAEGEGGKTSALEVKAEGNTEGFVFCILVFGGHIQR